MSTLNQFIIDNHSDMLSDLTNIVKELKLYIRSNPNDYIEYGTDEPAIDIRLCIDEYHYSDGYTWIFRTGLSDYDQVHSQYCSALCVSLNTNPTGLLNELINQLYE